MHNCEHSKRIQYNSPDPSTHFKASKAREQVFPIPGSAANMLAEKKKI